MENKKIVKNTVMLYIMTFAKTLLPMLTFPYLTRVLSTETYGVMTYSKSIMSYLQLIIEFGFMLSTTKEIVEALEDKAKINKICSDTLTGKMILCIGSFIVLIVMVTIMPILNSYSAFAFLSFIPIMIAIFLPDYLFRGVEQMQILTYRFIISKTISTILVFFFVKSDTQLLLIPVLDIIGTLVSVLLTYIELNKMEVKIRFGSISGGLKSIKTSFNYFVSNLAGTLLGAFNTLVIGGFFSASEIAYWGVANNLIVAVQGFYYPISDGIYPNMIKTKSKDLIKKILMLFMPIVIIGCIFCYFFAPQIVTIIGGSKYESSIILFRILLPVLFFSFPGILLGWSTLGALGKNRETTFTTILSGVSQVVLIGFLIITSNFNVWTIAICRCISEFILCISRLFYVIKYKHLFNK